MSPLNSIKKKKLDKEFWTEEGCFITELLNDAKSPNLSIALLELILRLLHNYIHLEA